MRLESVAHAVRVLVGLTLLTTGTLKLVGVHLDWEGQFIPFNYTFWVGLSSLEIIVGLVMCLPFDSAAAKAAAYTSILMSSGFLLFHLSSLGNQGPTPCRCLGKVIHLSHLQMAGISAFLLLGSIVASLFPRK